MSEEVCPAYEVNPEGRECKVLTECAKTMGLDGPFGTCPFNGDRAKGTRGDWKCPGDTRKQKRPVIKLLKSAKMSFQQKFMSMRGRGR